MAGIIIPPWKFASSTDISPRSIGITSIYGNTQGFQLSVGGTATATGQLDVISGSSSRIAQIIKAAASQSADLLQCQDSTGTSLFEINSDGTVSFFTAGGALASVNAFGSSASFTLAGTAPRFFSAQNTLTYTSSPAFGLPPLFFAWQTVVKATSALTMFQPAVFYTNATYTADGAVWTGGDLGGIASFVDFTTYSIANGGSFTTYTHNGYRSGLTVGTGATIATRRAIQIDDAGGAGTLTTQVGIRIADLTKGGTNIAIQQLGTTAQNRLVSKTKFGADSAPNVDCDVNGWINYAGEKRVSTQFDKTNTTLADVTGLSVTVVAGRTYRFRSVLFVDASAAGGQKYAIAGTATATAIIYNITTINDTSNLNVITSRQTALGGNAGQAGSTTNFTTIDGTITVNAGGTLTVQFAQNTASGTSSVLVGSTFTVWDVV